MPRACVESQAWWHTQDPSAGGEKDRRPPGVLQPEFMSSRVSERQCPQIIRWKVTEDTLMHPPPHTLTHLRTSLKLSLVHFC